MVVPIPISQNQIKIGSYFWNQNLLRIGLQILVLGSNDVWKIETEICWKKDFLRKEKKRHN